MLKNVLKIEGLTVLKREEKLVVKGQSCLDDAWEYGTRNVRVHKTVYAGTDWFYTNFCM
ncbi:hypothetical protein [Aquimarina megaterium]|uniref:hypothetical protein n=1 Tax=Aquimarina megaterium TaxID=1443666 RepID=UPI000A8703A8|nr:hypothetical protein [Aquimarina megaterium]